MDEEEEEEEENKYYLTHNSHVCVDKAGSQRKKKYHP